MEVTATQAAAVIYNGILVLVAGLCAVVLLRPRFRRATGWRATVTPLASIIGSGFLVIAPLLHQIVNGWAPLAILGVALLAYGVGGVIRFNIRYVEPKLERGANGPLLVLERLSGLALAGAYVISVAFYVRLLGAFVLRRADADSALIANIIASAILLFIGYTGLRRGLRGLEWLEEYAVALKLAIIAALLVGLGVYDFNWVKQSGPSLNMAAPDDWVHMLRLLGGVLLVVQGFETSRYIGHEYDAATRIRSMRFAQLIAAGIYVVFVGLSLPLLTGGERTISETALITVAENVAWVLPGMLIIAATMSQFSAAVADTIGGGGLFAEGTDHRVSIFYSYAGVSLLAIALVWTADVFELVAYASRAFALYYLLQTLGALAVGARMREGKYVARQALFFLLSIVLVLIVLFAVPAETVE